MKYSHDHTSTSTEKIPEGLATTARVQLEKEISILKKRLEELEAADEDNSTSNVTRKSYAEMLQNRQEILNTLTQQ